MLSSIIAFNDTRFRLQTESNATPDSTTSGSDVWTDMSSKQLWRTFLANVKKSDNLTQLMSAKVKPPVYTRVTFEGNYTQHCDQNY